MFLNRLGKLYINMFSHKEEGANPTRHSTEGRIVMSIRKVKHRFKKGKVVLVDHHPLSRGFTDTIWYHVATLLKSSDKDLGFLSDKNFKITHSDKIVYLLGHGDKNALQINSHSIEKIAELLVERGLTRFNRLIILSCFAKHNISEEKSVIKELKKILLEKYKLKVDIESDFEGISVICKQFKKIVAYDISENDEHTRLTVKKGHQYEAKNGLKKMIKPDSITIEKIREVNTYKINLINEFLESDSPRRL